MNYGEMVQEVRDITEALDPKVDARLLEFVNQAVREAEDRHIFKEMEQEAIIVTVPGDDTYGMPANWQQRMDRPYWMDGLGTFHRMDWVSSRGQVFQQFPRPGQAADRGPPVYLREEAAQYRVFPVPDQNNPPGPFFSDGHYRIFVPYATRIGIVSSLTHTNVMSDQRHPYITARAAAEAFYYNRDLEAASVWRGRAKAFLDRYILFDKRARFHMGEALHPVLGAYDRPNSRRYGGRL